jgi:hypothetical protein
MKRGAHAASVALTVLSIIVNLYVFSVFIAVPYYNWQYAREHTFRDWLIWGEITPTIEGFGWPYFAIRGPRSSSSDAGVPVLSEKQINVMNIRLADRAMAAAAQSTYVINARSNSFLSPEETEQVITYQRQALLSADATNQEALNNLYPEFGTRFKRDFCGGAASFRLRPPKSVKRRAHKSP